MVLDNIAAAFHELFVLETIFLMMVGISIVVSLFPYYSREFGATPFELGLVFVGKPDLGEAVVGLHSHFRSGEAETRRRLDRVHFAVRWIGDEQMPCAHARLPSPTGRASMTSLVR